MSVTRAEERLAAYDYTLHADAVAGDDHIANRPRFIDYQIGELSNVSVDCLDTKPFDIHSNY